MSWRPVRVLRCSSFRAGHILKYARMCKYDAILLLAEVERWLSMDPTRKAATAARIAKKLHIESNPVRVLRHIAGLTAREFADRVGCDRFCVYKTENGVTNPQEMTLNRFAEVLGVSADELRENLTVWRNDLRDKDPYVIIEDHLKSENGVSE